MGKQLIIKGADFSENCLPVTDLTSQAIFSEQHQFLHYPNSTASSMVNVFQKLGSTSSTRLYILNVSSYTGKILRFKKSRAKKAEEWEDGPVYNACFASEVNVEIPYTGNTVQNACTSVRYLNGKGSDTADISIYVEVIPEDAHYLIVTVNPVLCPFDNVRFEIIG